MSDAARVNVVIPNRNGMKHLEECFSSLYAQSFQDFTVTFVDNASSDDSVSWVERNYPDVRVIARAEDGGFSSSVNAGITATACEFVAIINNDIRLDPGWLSGLVDELDARPDFDFATPLLIMYYEPDKVNAAGDVFHLPWLAMANRGWGRPVEEFTRKQRVFGATANGVLYRASFFDDVGLYDEDFYLQHEDSDINLRAVIAGKKCVFVPESRLFHKIRSSGDQYRPEELARLNVRNEGFVVGKGLPYSMLAGHILNPRHLKWTARMLLSFMPWMWRFFSEHNQEVLRRSRQWVEGYRMGLRKRADVWARQGATMDEIQWWIRNKECDL